MSVNLTPIFALPDTGSCRVAVANTASDGSGTIGTVYTAGANGSRIDKITVFNSQATAAASSAMVLRLFLSDVNGSNFRPIAEAALATATRSTTAVGATNVFTFSGGLVMKSGQLVGAAQSVYASAADQTDWVVQQGGAY